MLSDLEIAQSASIRPIKEIAQHNRLSEENIVSFGGNIAKIKLKAQHDLKDFSQSKYIIVTALTPTPLGEGKTTTTIGLTQGLAFLGKKSLCAIRQPSMGPTFGIKGGAAGGGYSQIIPMEDFNLHLTGDFHGVSAAHNLGAAALDARIYHESRWGDAFLSKQGLSRLHIDPCQLLWRRVVDMNDRGLRHILTGMGEREDGPIRQSGFDITAASELMAILALSTSLKDMRERIGRIIIALDRKGNPVKAEEMGVAGAMTVLLKDALQPNLMQTLEGQAALVHTGPFGNIAHGNSSVIADLIGSHMGDYLITEAGFGSDMGLEKFIDIKCRISKMMPHAIVLVATVRALKMHGGGPSVTPGKKLDPLYQEKNCPLVRAGGANLEAHIKIALSFGVPLVVAINAFPTDHEEEWKIIQDVSLKAGAVNAVVTRHWEQGGKGAAELALAVEKAVEMSSNPRFLYDLVAPLKEKIEILAHKVYQAGKVEFSPLARKKLEIFTDQGFAGLPVCMAKTQYSLSHDPQIKNIPPKDYLFPVRDIRLSAGAGFIYPLAGEISTMPGLGSRPAFMGVDLDVNTGKITGLF